MKRRKLTLEEVERRRQAIQASLARVRQREESMFPAPPKLVIPIQTRTLGLKRIQEIRNNHFNKEEG